MLCARRTHPDQGWRTSYLRLVSAPGVSRLVTVVRHPRPIGLGWSWGSTVPHSVPWGHGPRTHPEHGPDPAIDAWWRAANYLTVGQIYLLDNPLLTRPIDPDDVKPRLLGHWGTSPALNLVYAHCNALIAETDRDLLYVCAPDTAVPR